MYTPQFKRAFNEIMQCGEKYYSRSLQKELFRKIQNSKDLLQDNPAMGVLCPSLAHTGMDFRQIVLHKFLILVYFIIEDTLFYADLWDTRRDPSQLINRLT